MTAAVAGAVVCSGPQAVVCIGVLAALTAGALIVGMSASPEDIDDADETAPADLTGADALSCTGDCADDCIQLSQQIDAKATDVQQRLERMIYDEHDLFNTARTVAENWGRGSWEGHQDRYEFERQQLRDLIALADSRGCHVSEFARVVADEEAPSRPGYEW